MEEPLIPKKTPEICELAVDYDQDMITKALSRALRELAKADGAPVVEFLRKHQSELHPRVVREVKNKPGTGLKSGRKG